MSISHAGFNLADLIVLVIIALSMIISVFRGFVREALSLASWVIAFWVALHFCHLLANLLTPYLKSPTLRLGIGFGGLLIVVLILCAVLNHIISVFVDKTGLSGMDRLLGVIFGLARGILVVSALLLVGRLTPMPEETWWQNSLTIKRFEPVEAWLVNLMPDTLIEHFKLSKK